MQNYPAFQGRSDPELQTILEDALSLFLDLTHRSDDPGEAVDSLLCDIAKSTLARAGQDGVKRAKDGEMEREWADPSVGSLDATLLKRIKSYRQVVGVNATPLF